VRSLGDVWLIVTEAASVFGATYVGVGPRPEFSHRFEGHDTGAVTAFQYRFAVPGSEAVLELGWTDGRREIDRDTEIAVEIFCEHLAEAFDTLKTETQPPKPARPPGPSA
jgi:hypothetical protein